MNRYKKMPIKLTDVTWSFLFFVIQFIDIPFLNVDKVLNLINPHVTIVAEERNGGK